MDRRDDLWCVYSPIYVDQTRVNGVHSVFGSACVELNDYYSQCQPGATAPSSTVPAPTSTAPGSTPTGGSGGLSAFPASKLTQFSNFGENPNNVQMFVYRPARVAANPPLIVASHCESLAPLSGYMVRAKELELT